MYVRDVSCVLGGAGPRQGQYSSIGFSPVHVCERDVVLFVTAPEAHGGGLVSVQTLVPLGVWRRIQWDAFHVFHVQVKILALWRFVLLTVEEGHLLKGGMQVLTQHLDNLLEGGAHLGVVLPAHLHQVVSGWGDRESGMMMCKILLSFPRSVPTAVNFVMPPLPESIIQMIRLAKCSQLPSLYTTTTATSLSKRKQKTKTGDLFLHKTKVKNENCPSCNNHVVIINVAAYFNLF